jgi:hypothetical protein
MERIFGFRLNTYAKVMGVIAALGVAGLTAAFFISDPAARSDLMKDFGAIVFCALVCAFKSLGGTAVTGFVKTVCRFDKRKVGIGPDSQGIHSESAS